MDLIADLIAKIKNNINAKIPVLNVQANKLNTNLCDVMKKEGYIVDYKITEVDKKKFIDVTLNIKKNPIHGIKQVSKSSLRIYTDSKEIPKV
jgi:small subunit ribosomal protein S8